MSDVIVKEPDEALVPKEKKKTQRPDRYAVVFFKDVPISTPCEAYAIWDVFGMAAEDCYRKVDEAAFRGKAEVLVTTQEVAEMKADLANASLRDHDDHNVIAQSSFFDCVPMR